MNRFGLVLLTLCGTAHADGPAAARPSFDRTAASAALDRVDLSSCALPGAPAIAAHVSLTFEPSGTVSTVLVDGPTASPAAAGCVSALFERVRVPAFRGHAVKVGKTAWVTPVPCLALKVDTVEGVRVSIWIDGKRAGDAPVAVRVSPGAHRVTYETSDGQTGDIDVPRDASGQCPLTRTVVVPAVKGSTA